MDHPVSRPRARYPVSVTNESQSRVIVCRGAIATERRLLAEIDALAPSRPDELALPVRVIVPSGSLRLHLLRRLVQNHDAVAGVVIQTVSGAVHEVLERAGREMPRRQAASDLTVRWAAEEEPDLADELDGLTNGYDVVLGAVRDLVDAGFTPENEAGVLDQLVSLREVIPDPERRRAEALVRVATQVHRAGREYHIGPHAARIRAAAEVLTEMTGSPYFPGGLGTWMVPAGSLHFEQGPSVDVPLQWATYYDAADQAGLSRLYGGIHVEADDLQGRVMGAQCGRDAWTMAQRYWDGSARG